MLILLLISGVRHSLEYVLFVGTVNGAGGFVRWQSIKQCAQFNHNFFKAGSVFWVFSPALDHEVFPGTIAWWLRSEIVVGNTGNDLSALQTLVNFLARCQLPKNDTETVHITELGRTRMRDDLRSEPARGPNSVCHGSGPGQCGSGRPPIPNLCNDGRLGIHLSIFNCCCQGRLLRIGTPAETSTIRVALAFRLGGILPGASSVALLHVSRIGFDECFVT